MEGPSKPFYPDHALKDTIVGAVVFSLLLTFAIVFRPPLDAVANPTDATYVPRPEWEGNRRGSAFVTCHRPGGTANPIPEIRSRRDEEWLLSHARDPEVIAPGLRQPPSGGLGPGQAYAIVAYLRKKRVGVSRRQ